MSKFHKTASKHFPQLSSNLLKKHAFLAWVSNCPEFDIESIVLYKYHSKQKRYAVVIEVSDIDQRIYQTVRLIGIEGRRPLITEDLARIYKEGLGQNFKNEWIFFVKLPGEESHCLIADPQKPGGLISIVMDKKNEAFDEGNFDLVGIHEPHLILHHHKHSYISEAKEAVEKAVKEGEIEEELENLEQMKPCTITEWDIRNKGIEKLKSKLRHFENNFRPEIQKIATYDIPSASYPNFPDYFPRLNFNHLQIYAKRWVDKFKRIPIKSIALYRYSCEFKLSKYAKYVIVFVLDEKIPEEVYSKFDAKLAYCTDDDADGQKVIDELLIDKNFQDVYKEQPESDFLSEWQFLPKILGKKMPGEIMTKEPHWVLFPVEDFSSTSIHGISNKTPGVDFEGFIRKFEVFYEDNSGVKIKKPGESPIYYSHNLLDFRENTDTGWRRFLDVIENPPHRYHCGEKYRKKKNISEKVRYDHAKKEKQYDRRQKRLRGINEKLIKSFNKHFSMSLPSSFKFYELDPTKGAGAYKFKFKVCQDGDQIEKISTNLNNLSEKKLWDHIQKLKSKDPDSEELIKALTIGYKKRWLTENEVKDFFPEHKKQEEIYDTYENE